MQIETTSKNDTVIIHIIGSVDAMTAPKLEKAVESQIEMGNYLLVIDLSQVEFMSSAGLRALLAALKGCHHKGGELHLAGAQPGVKRTMEIAGFTELIKIFPNVESATTSFNQINMNHTETGYE